MKMIIKLNGINGDPVYVFTPHITVIMNDPDVVGRTRIYMTDGDPTPLVVKDDIEKILMMIN